MIVFKCVKCQTGCAQCTFLSAFSDFVFAFFYYALLCGNFYPLDKLIGVTQYLLFFEHPDLSAKYVPYRQKPIRFWYVLCQQNRMFGQQLKLSHMYIHFYVLVSRD